MPRIRTLFVFGTRPEAIKLCPVIRHFAFGTDDFDVRVCVTAQHREMLDQVLEAFEVAPHHDLNAMREAQSLTSAASRILGQMEGVLKSERPDIVIVQGDTTTTLCGALAAFHAGVPVAHVEAGLRTGDLLQPFPEEMNRVLTGRLAAIHFAATRGAAANLEAEHVPAETISVTGNTGIDALLFMCKRLETGSSSSPWHFLDPSKKLIVATLHRRENFGEGVSRICEALRRVADKGVQIVCPVHPNPGVSGPVRDLLASHPGIRLVDPLDYVAFVDLLRRAHFVITDSGGIQEEAPSLGKPVLVLREKTERPEAVEAGTATLVGTDADRIVEEASRLLEDEAEYRRRSRIGNPYGDGHASERIAEGVLRFFEAGSPRAAN